MSNTNQDQTGINCKNCMYYYITHDVNFRYGCRALDFKSRRLPMLDVAEASGQPCQYFKIKRSNSA